MKKADSQVAEMLRKLNNLDNANKSRLVENARSTGKNILKESADPDQIMQLAARYKAGEITYDEFKSEMETLEYTDYSMRQGEMGNPDMRDDWAGSDEYDDEEDEIFEDELSGISINDEEADEDEIRETVNKSQIPAVQRKQSGDPDWKLTQKDLEKEEEKNISSTRGLAAQQVRTGVKEEEETEQTGQADPEIMEWMQRFNKLR